MKHMNGLYVSFVLMMFITLLDTAVFEDAYSGIAMFISTAVFVVGTAFFIQAKQAKENGEE